MKDIPTPSALFSNVHTAYDNLTTSITNMATPSDYDGELWRQFEVSVQSVVDAFRRYVELEISFSFVQVP